MMDPDLLEKLAAAQRVSLCHIAHVPFDPCSLWFLYELLVGSFSQVCSKRVVIAVPECNSNGVQQECTAENLIEPEVQQPLQQTLVYCARDARKGCSGICSVSCNLQCKAEDEAKELAKKREELEEEMRLAREAAAELPAIHAFGEGGKGKRSGRDREEKLARRRARCANPSPIHHFPGHSPHMGP